MGISQKQFAEIQKRISGGRRVAAPAVPVTRLVRSKAAVILGIDPSLRGTGYGIIRAEKIPAAIVHGTIRCPAGMERSRCLAQILTVIRQVVAEHRPECCVVEGLFFAQNLQTAITMGEARGAALAAVAEAGLEIFEMAPRKVKQAVVGYGAAQKTAIARMVQRMLRLPAEPAPDEADALALALAFAQETSNYSLNSPKRV